MALLDLKGSRDQARVVVEGRDIRGVAVHHLPSLRRGEAGVQEERVTRGLKSATAYISSEGVSPFTPPLSLQFKPTGPQGANLHFTRPMKQKRNSATANVAGPGTDNSTLRLVGNRVTRRKLQGTSGPKQRRLESKKTLTCDGGRLRLKVLRQLPGQTSVDALPPRPQGHLAKRAAHKRFKGHRVG